jgi:hypothetical protein
VAIDLQVRGFGLSHARVTEVAVAKIKALAAAPVTVRRGDRLGVTEQVFARWRL